MTTLVATSVVRGSHQGESHGGVYLIDLEGRRVVQAVDWNKADIDWQGRGWDRGLRGIAFDGDTVYIAASDELFAFTPEFQHVASFRNPFLKHCHEIVRYERRLYLTSTGFDSILGFDLDERQFSFGLNIIREGGNFRGQPFNPSSQNGPMPGNDLHVNNVYCTDRGMYISGLRTGAVLVFDGRRITSWATLPEGAHNAIPFRDGLLFNDTRADAVRFASPSEDRIFNVPRYDTEKLTHADLDESRIARQGFARGLCVLEGGRIAAGSSPSTISLHDLDKNETLLRVTLTMDIRNAVHGLEVWPYAFPEVGSLRPDQ
jgi:hypothetical protein